MPDDRVGWPLLQTIKGGSHKKTGFHRKSSEILLLPTNLPKSLKGSIGGKFANVEKFPQTSFF